MGKIILVTGGARSGKSSFAEQLARDTGSKVTYIATAQIFDEEMKIRVNLHRARRPGSWKTCEAPYGADKAVLAAAREAEVILFDCLTLYTSNLLLRSDNPADAGERFSLIMNEVDRLIDAAVLAASGGVTVIFVTNEVGLGIVPDNILAREYRDVAGIANQRVAARADEVFLVVSGLAVELKRLAVNAGTGGRHG